MSRTGLWTGNAGDGIVTVVGSWVFLGGLATACLLVVWGLMQSMSGAHPQFPPLRLAKK